MCLGTSRGALHLLDHLGHSSQQQEFPSHGMAVKMVDIDSGGDYIASCSDDGKVRVTHPSNGIHIFYFVCAWFTGMISHSSSFVSKLGAGKWAVYDRKLSHAHDGSASTSRGPGSVLL